MMKIAIVGVIVVVLAAVVLYAQTTTHKPAQAARPNTNAPTKVTGDGVKTESGLQYWDIKVGTGEAAKDGDHVKVHYTGWLTSGKKFDSSVDAHQPYDFTIGKGEGSFQAGERLAETVRVQLECRPVGLRQQRRLGRVRSPAHHPFHPRIGGAAAAEPRGSLWRLRQAESRRR